MLRILYSGVRHARLGAWPFLKLGPAIVESVDNGASLERLPCKAQMPLPPRRRPSYLSDLESFTMSNVSPRFTGLPMVVYVSTKNANHGPLVKVSKIYGITISGGYWFSITVADEPSVIGNTGPIKKEDVKLVKQWILLNRDVLIRYWEQKCETVDMINSLKKV